MQIVAKIHSISDAEAIGEKGFRVRKFIVTTDWTRQYPQYVAMQCTQDNVTMLDRFKVGDVVTIDFEIEGRMYDKKDASGALTGEKGNFTTLRAWSIQTGEQAAQTAANAKTDDVPF